MPDFADIDSFLASNHEALRSTLDADLLIAFPGYRRSDLRKLKQSLIDAEEVGPAECVDDEADMSTEQVIRYMRRARTYSDILQRFGRKVAEQILAKDVNSFPGYSLFEQVDEFGEPVFALLATSDPKIGVLPRNWACHVPVDEDGDIQPYLLAQLPDFTGTIQIAPLFDVHFGHHKHRSEKFLSYLEWIQSTPNVYALLGGDLMENALDDGRGHGYDQVLAPSSQFDSMLRLLAPIAHKVLFALSGNHEERTYKRTGIDIMKLMAARLSIPYFSGPVLCCILANGHRWRIFAQHGTSNSQTKGGKLNSAQRPAKFTNDVDFFISGHVHDRMVDAETILVEDPINSCLRYKNQWTVICPSFLGWMNTYAYRAGYRPPSLGGVAIHLYDDGSCKADMTT